MSRQKSLVKNTFILALGNISTQLVGFILLPVYTVFISPAEYGLVDLILTYVMLLVPIITLQSELSAFRFLIDARKDPNRIANIISNCLIAEIVLLTSFVILASIVNYIYAIPHFHLVVTIVITTSFVTLMLQIARGLGLNSVYAKASILTAVSNLSMSIVLIMILKLGVEGIFLSSIISSLLCILFLVAKLNLKSYANRKMMSKEISFELLRFSSPFVPNGVSLWVINVSDRTIISIILGVFANGLYAIASKFSLALVSVANIFILSWTESASLHIKDSDRDSYFSDIFNKSITAFISLGMLIISLLPFIFNHIIDSRYSDAFDVAPILITASIFSILMSMYGGVYVALKLSSKIAYTSIAAALINVVATVLLLPLLNIAGAAYATMLAYIVTASYRHIDLKKHIQISYNARVIFLIAVVYAFISYLTYSQNIHYQLFAVALAIITAFIFNKWILQSTKQIYLDKRRKGDLV